MQEDRVPYKKIVFVCTNKRENGEACCAARGGLELAEALKAKVKTLGLARHIRVSKSGCHDVCAKGASVMLFPDYRWYSQVKLEDVDAIIADLI